MMASSNSVSDSTDRNVEWVHSFNEHLKSGKPLEEFEQRSHSPPPKKRRAPAIPDFRFEQSFLRSIKPYVHIERQIAEDIAAVATASGEKGAEKHETRVMLHEDIRVRWGRVMWITLRDQVISPLLQGALRGLASVFLSPLLVSFGASFRSWWAKGATRTEEHHTEGHGVGWLRNKMAELMTASSPASASTHVR
ncbi:uncharacterized protein LAESUDRAFT_682732 [Laetiporus sulphureus 93-53]|uniref:Uncharacterized protein n=1 Tax=Laetiporus sulphureus 93-53 TaxID=1314785 RepID=A0A165DBT9_9APHY|nr:uncharacterized protein LAESUDRAFT_682732 [Laetiporus sulphureus 93-53]KZT04514.1 hypothetical protein LAESUDRAFT_682732 [Laetiporus sulphureus 93-53]